MTENIYISQRIVDRINGPRFLLNEKPGSYLNSEFFKFDIPNSNGFIEIFYRIEASDKHGEALQNVKYFTNIKGVELAFVDAAVELLNDRNIQVNELEYREVEYFLRDDNSTPAIESNSGNIHRVLSFMGTFYQSLRGDNLESEGVLSSPDFDEDYFLNRKPEDEKEFGHFFELDRDGKKMAIDTVLRKYIRPMLQKDSGDVECVHFSDGMIVIQYFGNCSSCDSSLTSTMDYIQNVFRSEFADPQLAVVTDS